MAIAPLMEYEGLADGTCGLLERPWPVAVFRVVPPPAPGAEEEEGGGALRDAPFVRAQAGRSGGALRARPGRDVADRRLRRTAVVRRRRALLLGAVVAGLVVLLALPLGALGGSARVPRGAGTAVVGATVYMVQPGDTLWSIASRFDRGGNPRPLAEGIAKETGSTTVVPGERISIP